MDFSQLGHEARNDPSKLNNVLILLQNFDQNIPLVAEELYRVFAEYKPKNEKVDTWMRSNREIYIQKLVEKFDTTSCLLALHFALELADPSELSIVLEAALEYPHLYDALAKTESLLERILKYFLKHAKDEMILEFLLRVETEDKKAKTQITKCMEKILQKPKKILPVLHILLPKMGNPTIAFDYLVQSLSLGGMSGILALDGLYLLMKDYNLDYPDFFNQIYAMLDGNIFHLKYRIRFFKLFDKFMQSSLISSEIVAKFIKRLAHLQLFAPPSSVLFIIAITNKLIKAHPACKYLVESMNVSEDSLYSIQSEHYYHQVERMKKIYSSTKSEIEYWNVLEMLSEEFDRGFKKIPPFRNTPLLFSEGSW